MTRMIKRYDMNGTCYGETIFKGTTRQCLEYLKNAANIRTAKSVVRSRDTWTATHDTNIFHYALYNVGAL